MNIKSIVEEYGSYFPIRVIPKSSRQALKIEQQPDGTQQIRIYVTSAPEDGKANQDVIKVLAKNLHLPKSAFQIVRGSKSKDKVVKVIWN